MMCPSHFEGDEAMKSSSISRGWTLLFVMLSLLIAGSTSYGAFDIARLVTITNPAPAVADLFGNSMAGLGTDKVVIGAYLDDASGTDTFTMLAGPGSAP
jgi:hypothetical protein